MSVSVTKTWLRSNLKTGSNPYGAGFRLWINGQIKADYRSVGYTKDEIVDRIYELACEEGMHFDEISLHSPSANGMFDSGNRVGIPEKFLDRPSNLAQIQKGVARTLENALRQVGAGNVEIHPATSFGGPWTVSSEQTGAIDVRRKQVDDQAGEILLDGLKEGQRVITMEDEPDTARDIIQDFVNEAASSGEDESPVPTPDL